MKHIGIFSNSGAVQTAIENETLLNPYVALVSGSLDYNGIQPAPCYLGEWSDDGEGTYTFQTTIDKWKNPLQIGVLNNVLTSPQAEPENIPVYLNFHPESFEWYLIFGDPEDSVAQMRLGSPTEDYVGGPNGPIMIGYTIDPEEEGILYFNWGGDIMEDYDGKLELYSNNSNFPLSMTTINPLCSDAEPVTCQDLGYSSGEYPDCYDE